MYTNVFKLKDVTGNLSKIYIDLDMTLKEREETKAMLAEAKEKEEKSLEKLIYRVRGPPWNRYIKKRLKQN